MKKLLTVLLAIALLMTALPAFAEVAEETEEESIAGFWYVAEVVIDGVAHISAGDPAFEGRQYVLYLDPSGTASLQEYYEAEPRIGTWNPDEYGAELYGVFDEYPDGVSLVAIGDDALQCGLDPENNLQFYREPYHPLVGKYYLNTQIDLKTMDMVEYPEWEAEPGQDKRIVVTFFPDGTGRRYDELQPEKEPAGFAWEKLPEGFTYKLTFTDGEEITITQTPDYIDFSYDDADYNYLFRRMRE